MNMQSEIQKFWGYLVPTFLASLYPILFPLFWSQFQWTSAELRFCLPQYGPQKMMDSDCPGGFVFKEPIIASDCKYYLKTGDHVKKVLTTPTDFCAADTERVLENQGDDMEDVPTLAYFIWENFDEANESIGFLEEENVCEEDCLADWEDPHAVAHDDPIPDDFDPSTVSEAMQKELKTLNKELFMYLLMDDDEDSDERPRPSGPMVIPPSKPTNSTVLPPRRPPPTSLQTGQNFFFKVIHDSTNLNVIKILAKSMKIILSSCTPYIPEEFLEQVLRGMLYISWEMEHSFLDIAPDIYRRLVKTLDHCGLKHQQEFTINGSRCNDMTMVEGIYFIRSLEYWPYRLQGWSFRWGRWHPLLDAAWSVIDFVHSFCFESFMQDMMMLHIYVMSLEGLFPENIQLLWRVQPIVNNDKFWNNLMQTHDLNITMRNLDACQEAARRASPYLKPLPRPFLTLAELTKPAPPPPPPPIDKGWTKTLAQYWDRYDSLGGFPKLSGDFGKCFDEAHREEEEYMIETLRRKCP